MFVRESRILRGLRLTKQLQNPTKHALRNDTKWPLQNQMKLLLTPNP